MRTFCYGTLSMALGVVLGTLIFIYSRQPIGSGRKPNIVVLSFCSLRKAELKQFGSAAGENLTPNLQSILDQSYFFTNAFSRYGWTNPSLYMMDQLQPRFFEEHGYDLVGTEAAGRLFRVPSDVVQFSTETPSPKGFVHNYKLPLAYLRHLWSQPRLKPFYSYVHVKYMHYPYIDDVNAGTHWDHFLNPQEKLRVATLLKETQSPGALPLKLILTGDPTYAGEQDFYDIYKLFSDPKTMATWMAEATYPSDLEIVKKVYRAKLADFDANFAGLFELFALPHLLENTILIVTGDHGEAMMEHGRLGHADDVYDETITFPLAVRFPHTELKSPFKIDRQFFQGSMTELIRGLVDGSITEDNFVQKMTTLPQNEMIVSRNCANTEQSLRWKNKWKYMQSANAPERLFDLEHDPSETQNVIDQNADIAVKMKFYLIDHASELTGYVDFSPCRQTS